MLLSDLAKEDFEKLKKDSIANQKYASLSHEEQKKYENRYKSNFEDEFKILRSQLMESAKIDKTTAGQIMLKEIKNAHSNGNHFMGASGNIDTEKFIQIKVNIEQDIKSGKYDNLIQNNNHKEENQNIINDDTKKIVDFNNPEEKKEYFKNLFDEYSNLKTEEEKEQFKREKFYDYDNNKEVIDLTCDIEVRVAELKKEEPEKTDKECVEQVYEEKAEETGRTKEEIAVDHELGLLYGEYQERRNELNNIDKNSPEYSKKKKELEETRKRMKLLEKSKEEKQENEEVEDILNADFQEEQEIEDLEDILNEDTEAEQENDDLEDILNADIEAEQENDDLEDILNADFQEEQEIEDLEENIMEEDIFDISDSLENIEDEQQQENKEVQYNQILGPLGVTELEKEEFNLDSSQVQETALVEYKPNRLKNFFNNIITKIKESNLFKKITGKNENNVVETDNLEQKMKQANAEKTSFNDSLIVSKEEQEKNRKENENNVIKTGNVSLSFGDRDGK